MFGKKHESVERKQIPVLTTDFVPNRQIEYVGFISVENTNLKNLMKEIAENAEALQADAVVGLRINTSIQIATFYLGYGTAVRFVDAIQVE